ncbi:Uncharacterised protein [Yersinia frederiksenii]|nr:Uncharacterised protein [Yersinia frederiksenii]CNI08197.1 Uncharacterised protein [Yersinia frederiksenii]
MDYNRRSIAETAMYKVTLVFGGSLITQCDNDGRVVEFLPMIRTRIK